MGKSYSIVMLPGDGTGVEVSGQSRRLLDAIQEKTNLHFSIKTIECGGQYYLDYGRDWPEGSEEICAASDLILLGAVGWPSPNGKGPVTMSDGKMAGYSPVIGNRLKLDLYANLRPVKLLSGVKHQISGQTRQVWKPEHVDMVFLRENTEGLYAGVSEVFTSEGQTVKATDTRVITRRACERIVKMAFEIAQKRNGAPGDGKKRVTLIVKNNVLDGCRLFSEVFHEIGAQYPEIEKESALVDAFTQWLITQPERYDVCVTSNMFGDIVTDLASVLQGGMGMAVGCNIGDNNGMFEPIHGSAPPLAHQDKANPIAMLLATSEGLKWLGGRHNDVGLQNAGEAIEAAIIELLTHGKPLTFDLVGEAEAASMTAVTNAVIEKTLERLS
ncbi:MAG: isocitrate/isopropylmalate dehydrogenase family protein [Bradymonadia bacterium]